MPFAVINFPKKLSLFDELLKTVSSYPAKNRNKKTKNPKSQRKLNDSFL